MTAALLDTSVLIALAAHDEPSPDLSEFDDVRVSALSWIELTIGLHTVDTLPAYRRRQAAFTEMRRVFGEGVPFDEHCVTAFQAVLDRVVERDGTPRAHVFDRMIAATAIANQLVLVTRNAADLRGLNGLIDIVER